MEKNEKDYFEPNNLRKEFLDFYTQLPKPEKKLLAFATHTWLVHQLNAGFWARKSIIVDYAIDAKNLGISINTLRSNLQYLQKHKFVSLSKAGEQKNSEVICTLLNRSNGTKGSENVQLIDHVPETQNKAVLDNDNINLTETIFLLKSSILEEIRRENEAFKAEIRATLDASFEMLEIQQNAEIPTTQGKVQEFAPMPLAQNSYNPQNQTPEALKREREFAREGKEFITIENCVGYLITAMQILDNKAEIDLSRRAKDYLAIMGINPEFNHAWLDFVEMRTYTLNNPFKSVQEAVGLLIDLYHATFGKKGERYVDDVNLIKQATFEKREFICLPPTKKQAKPKKQAEPLADSPEIALLKEIDAICSKEYPKSEVEIAAAKAALAVFPAEKLLRIVKQCVKMWSADVLRNAKSTSFLDAQKLQDRGKKLDEMSKITMIQITDMANRATLKNFKEFMPMLAHDETLTRYFTKLVQGAMQPNIFINQCEIHLNKK